MNLANKITLVRIFLVPVFMFFILTRFLPNPYNQYFAAFIFIIASVTDTLDGYIARSRNMVTNFGKFLDPLADKLLVTAALISLVEIEKVPAWIAIVIISREFIVTALRVVAAAEGMIIAASWWGKFKTITQIVAIVALLINNFPFSFLPVQIPFDTIMLYIAVAITIISGVDYINKNKDTIIRNAK